MFNDCSVEYIAEVVLVQQFLVLLVGNTEALKHVIDVGLAEQGAVLEAGQVGVNVIVIFDCFDYIALSVKLKELLGDKSVTIVKWNVEVGEISIRSVEVGWVTEGSLVVGNWPSWG